MGNDQSKQQGYEQVQQNRQDTTGNGQHIQAILKKIQQIYPQINKNELEIFANSNRDIIFWSIKDSDFETKVQKALFKHFNSQENKYSQAIEKLYQHRQAQILDKNKDRLLLARDDLNQDDMKIIFENATLLEKFDKMKDFFLIKQNNPLQLSLHVTFLVNTFKQIIDNGDQDEDIYIAIIKEYTSYSYNLSKLLQLCGFIEFNEDHQTIGLYYERKDLNLIKALWRYVKQKYHQNIKPIESIIKEIQEQNKFNKGQNIYNQDYSRQQNQQQVRMNDQQLSRNNQLEQNQSNKQQQIQNQNNQNLNDEQNAAQNQTHNNNTHAEQRQILEQRYQKKSQPTEVKISQIPIYQQISSFKQSKVVQERVKAQIEARQRREEKSRQEQNQKNNQINQQPLFNESESSIQTSQNGIAISQFEMQDLNPKETQEIRLGKDITGYINKFRSQNKLSNLVFDISIYPTCEDHSKKMATGEVNFGHDNFDSRAREVSVFSNFNLICESVASSTTPVDSHTYNFKSIFYKIQKVVQDLINHTSHRNNILSQCTHVCVGVYKQILFFLTKRLNSIQSTSLLSFTIRTD